MKQLWTIAALSLSLALPGLATAEVVSFDPSAGYTGGSDTWVSAHHNSNNAGTQGGQNRNDGRLLLRQHGPDAWHSYQGLMRFDNILGLGPGQVPTAADFGSSAGGFLRPVVNDATLQLNLSRFGHITSPVPYNAPVRFFRLTEDWDENTVIYNSFNNDGTRGPQPITEVALPFVDELIPGGGGDPLKDSQTLGLKEIDLSEAVQAWLDGAPNFGFLISVDVANSQELDFSSFNNTDPSLRPVLTIDFTVVPEPASIALWCAVAFGGVVYWRRRKKLAVPA